MATNNMTRTINVYWDTQDPSNHGWAWRMREHQDGEYVREDSGPLKGRRGCGERTLTIRARAEAGVAGTRTPVTFG